MALDIEKDAAHSKNPLLDQLEIIAEAIGELLKDRPRPSESERRSLRHIRQMTRTGKAKTRKR